MEKRARGFNQRRYCNQKAKTIVKGEKGEK